MGLERVEGMSHDSMKALNYMEDASFLPLGYKFLLGN
jgi:hypothetical protein